MDNALMGAMIDISDKEWTVGILLGFVQVIYCIFLPLLLGNFDGFSAPIDGVTDGLPDRSTESNDVWTERKFPGIWTFRKFHTAILVVFSP